MTHLQCCNNTHTHTHTHTHRTHDAHMHAHTNKQTRLHTQTFGAHSCTHPSKENTQLCHISSCLRELFATEGRACARVTPRTLKTLQVLPNRMCTRISFFVSKTVRKIRDFFLATTKIQLKRVNHRLRRRTIDAPWTGRVREASSGPSKSLIQHGSVEKKKTGKLRE